MGANVEEVLTDLLIQPKTDYIIVEDLQYASQPWLELLAMRIIKAMQTGILRTVTVNYSHVALDFFCQPGIILILDFELQFSS